VALFAALAWIAQRGGEKILYCDRQIAGHFESIAVYEILAKSRYYPRSYPDVEPVTHHWCLSVGDGSLVIRRINDYWSIPRISTLRVPLKPIFVDHRDVSILSGQQNVELRYTLDGAEPTTASPRADGPARITETVTLKARAFRGGKPVGGVGQATFTKVLPQPALKVEGLVAGLRYDYYEGEWESLPRFPRLTPVESGTIHNFELSPRRREDGFAFRYRGHLTVPRTGVYRFGVRSDEGSRLYVDRRLVVDNDGLHSPREVSGDIALEGGLHSINLIYFERTEGGLLEVGYAGPGLEKQRVPDSALSHVEE